MRIQIRTFFVFLLIFSTAISFAQSNGGDSLRKAFLTCNNDTTKLKILNEMINALRAMDPDSAIACGDQMLVIGEKLKRSSDPVLALIGKKRIPTAHHIIGLYYYFKGEYFSSLEHFQKAMGLWEELIGSKDAAVVRFAKTGKAKSLVNIGNVYKDRADYPKALDYFMRSLSLAEELGLLQLQGGILGNIGILYYNQDDYETALKYHTRNLNIAEKMGDQMQIAGCLNNIGVVYQETKNYTKALDYYQRAFPIYEKMGNQQAIAINYGNIGSIYQTRGDSAFKAGDSKLGDEILFPKALLYFKKALSIMQEIGDKNGISVNESRVGTIYTNLKRYKEAETILVDALKLSKEIEATELTRANEQQISELYEVIGNHKLAFEHYKNSIALRDSINSEENQKQQVKTEMNYEFEKKEAVLKEEQEKERLVAEQKNRFQKVVIGTVFFGLLLVLIFAAFIFRTLKTTRKQKVVIEEKQKEILDSIHYARKIQTALMSNEKYIDKSLNKLQS